MGGNYHIVQHTLNGGEYSERFDARQDQAKRQTGLERCINWKPLVVGGVRRWEGSVYVATMKVVADHPIKRVLEFRASNEFSYVLELGHLYMRFYRNNAQIIDGTPLEITTPWQDTQLAELYPVESVDVMYFMHRSQPVAKLSRTGIATFVFSTVTFDAPPTIEQEPSGTDLSGGTLTPAATTGTNILFTASATPFLASDVGRLILSGAGRAMIIAVDTSATVHADIIDDFASTSAIAAGNWRLKLSPQTTIDVQDGKKEIGDTATLTAAVATWRTADVGKYVSVFGGLLKITGFTGSTIVTGKIKRTLKDITTGTPDPTRAWTLEVEAFSTALGYPSCGAFVGERFWLFKGLTCYGSVVGDFENFAKGGGDDDGIARTISDDQVDSIVWAKGLDGLYIGTGSGAFAAKVAEGQFLTPTNFDAKPISSTGSARIPPVRVNGLLHHVAFGQRDVREMVFDFSKNKFLSPSVFQLADHLVEGFYITELKYGGLPNSFEYVVRSDGTLLGLIYQEVENVIGWARRTTQGLIRSVAVIPRPSTGREEVWIAVERENGIFIEYFESHKQNPGREWNEAQTDSAVFTTHDEDFVITGLDHLEGETVRVIGDGILYDDAVVENGEITLSPQIPCSIVEVGLNYDSDGLTLEPIVPAQLGGPFMACRWVDIGVRVRRALGLTINGEQMAYRRADHPMDAQVPLQRGKVGISNLGSDPFNRISFKQTLPFPAEILNIVGKLHIGDSWAVGTEDNQSDPFTFIGGGSIEDMFIVDLVIGANAQDYVIYDKLLQAGWNGISPVTYTLKVNAGVIVSPSAAGNKAIICGGALPSGSVEPVWTIWGTVRGWSGVGGVGGLGNQAGLVGQPGGDAIELDYNVTITLEQSGTPVGNIWGGPGGGGGGGGGEN